MVTTRALVASDLETVCAHREAMFRETGRSEALLQQMAEPFRAWLRPRLADGSYFGFLAEAGERVVGGVGLILLDWPPHPWHPVHHRRGYVLNVYVEPPSRRCGIARRLMADAEAELRTRGIPYGSLHATEMGRALYEALGWHATKEMAKGLV